MNEHELFQEILEFTKSVYDSTIEIRKSAKPDTLTPQHYNILEIIYLHNTKSVSELCDCLDISMPNASRELKKLTELGYVKKSPPPNRQTKHNDCSYR